ncbi:aminophospholipid translocase [Polyrhizophydium stewartii]|uniref:Phospholipid-transporting ATPase n=1 Tax=Polyrhizophydium stewartii TaxID=2732419 RepID=A0ABR4NFL0_9FUNG|nr:hypothetical protein HK105_007137 [Polyrhizophydium stewartii]
MLLGDDGQDVAPASRIIHINDPIKNQSKKFLHNGITTGKYSVLTFIPRFLFEQFSKYANMFFLFVAIIQQIGDLSPVNKYGTVLPLCIVLAVSAAKEIMEDLKRHAQDVATNTRSVNVLSGSTFIPKPWREVVVGDIVRIENSQYFPADLVIISSSEPDALCYIETSNLDGETNLKIRQGLPETANILTPEQVASMEGVIKTELPNNSLYTFEGTLRLREKEIPLNPDQLLLRGAMLRNTRWVYGIVVFTGHESKLMKNSTATPIKRTHVEALVNQHIIFLFFILVAMSVICACGTLGRQLANPFETSILHIDSSEAWSRFPANILTYIILFNNLIPMSLIVTMEIVKFFLGTLINSDVDLYYEWNDTPATARTSSLIEELGQIDYIFSDKTGTLTCNMMEFRMVSIAGQCYAETVPDNKKPVVDELGKTTGWFDFARLREHDRSSPSSHVIREFFQLLAVCHTVIPEASEEDPGKIIFQASSPDEAALVKGAQIMGYVFTTRRPRSVTYLYGGKEYEWEVLQINEFNSTRKRMSAIVRSPEGKIKLYIKGADTVILERLAKSNNYYVDSTCAHLEEYANDGLRTLCIAYRDISEEEYAEWSKVYEKASTTINNRGAELDKAAELIEKDLFLLGATAIEDRLQDEVPDTIHTLATAGIKIWVLTGDRQETAINIGYSCKLITEEMSLIVCNEPTHFETKEFLSQKLAAVKGGMDTDGANGSAMWATRYLGGVPYVRHLVKEKAPKLKKSVDADLEPLALIIDGKSLTYALEDDIKMIFLELATLCKAVICCRVSPLQKALVVKLVKKNVESAVTLAIGDGANDVSMIQAAHVGIGISGMEGLQAARSADFAIAQFRFLRKLLLVHGGWAYSRLSKVVLYSFYKNITLYLIQLWFSFDNGFSGQTLFETWTQSSYNIVFAFFQPLAIGVFDQYVTARMLDRYPQLYQLGQTNEFYNHGSFWAWILNSFFHSLVMYYGLTAVYGEGTMLADGLVSNNWAMGEMIYTGDLITITLKAALTVDSWVNFTFFGIFGSIALWFILFPIYAVVGPMVRVGTELQGVNYPMFGSLGFWLGIVIIPVLSNLRDYIFNAKRIMFPRSYHIVQEINRFNIPDHRPRMEWFRKAVAKVRVVQRQKRSRGFAFSQGETGQAQLIRIYDTTRRKPRG